MNLYSKSDSWFWVSGSINPYRGCQHDCVYCDGKAEWYRIKNFGTHIRIKIDAPERFEEELVHLGYEPVYRPIEDTLLGYLPETSENREKKRKKRHNIFPIAIGGGVCDLYQPAERKFKVARKLLKKCRDFGIPVSLLTKSSLILRDLDLLSEINALCYANVSFSITLMDDEVREVFEPKSSSTYRRFESLKTVRKNNLPGGVMLMPILPGIGDTEQNLRSIIQKAKEFKANFILPGSLTLKPGRNKDEFISVIRQNYSNLLPIYEEMYGNNNKYGIPDSRQTKLNIYKLVHELCRKNNIPDRIPRYIPPGVIRHNFYVSTILFNLAYYYQWVAEKPSWSVSPFIKAAEAIESLSSDILKLDKFKLMKHLKLTNKEVITVISEVLDTGISTDLTEFQDPKTILTTG